LASENEIVVLCAASNSGTRHLIDKAIIDRLPPHAVFVIVARAALVDTDALVARLRRGDLFAAIDVFDAEPLPKDAALRSLPNAYLTPHRAGGIWESLQRNIDWLIDDLEAHLQGRPRKYAVTPAMIPSLDA
jgi:phosphoglycerate dehydrogenase-like enzyme